MKLLKLLGGLLLGLVLLLIVAVVVASWLINPNDYKPQIQELVQQQTGRELQLEGDLAWTLFPWLGIDIGRVSFSNAPAFVEESPLFAAVQHVQVQVRVLPLLTGELKLNTVRLEQVELWLAKDAQGATNWDDLAALGQSEEQPASQDSSLPFKRITIAGVVLADTVVHWADASSGSAYKVSGINVTSGEIQYPLSAPIPINLTANVQQEGSAAPLQANITLSTALALNMEAQQYALNKLALALTVQQAQLPNGQQTLRLNTAAVSADLAQQTLVVSGLTIEALEQLQLRSDAKIEALLTNPTLAAEVQLLDFSPRTVLQQFQVSLPENLKADALQHASFSTRLSGALQQSVEITNSVLKLDDGQIDIPSLHIGLADGQISMPKLNVDLLGVRGGGQLQVQEWSGDDPKVQADLALKASLAEVLAKLTTNAPEIPLAVQQAAFNAAVTGSAKALNVSEVRLQLDQHQVLAQKVLLHPEQSSVEVEQLSVQAFGVNAQAAVTLQQTSSGLPQVGGSLTVKPFNLQSVLAELKLPALELTDKQALTRISLQTQFSGTPQAPALTGLKLVLDDSTLQGNVAFSALDPLAVKFTLGLDKLNVDRYLPPSSDSATQEQTDKTKTAEASAPLPLELLQQLDVNGTVKVGELTAAGATVQNVNVLLQAKQGKISINNQLDLYSGQLQGNVQLNASQLPVQLRLDENLQQVSLQPLLNDVAQVDLLAGTTAAQLQLNSAFETPDQIMQALNGTIAMQMRDGVVNGFNLGRVLRQAKAIIKGDSAPPEEPLQSDFSSLTMKFLAQNGILQTEDLLMESPLLRVDGTGQIDLPQQTLDLRLNTMVVNTSTGQEGKSLQELSGIGIPVLLSGTFNSPQVEPDMKVLWSLGSAGLSHLLQKGVEAANPLEQGATSQQKQDEKVYQELGDHVNKLLKGWF